MTALLVPKPDIAAVTLLELPLALIAVSALDSHLSLQGADAAEIAVEQVMLGAVGCLALSSTGQEELHSVSALWRDKLGIELPDTFVGQSDSDKGRQAVLEWVIARMSASRHVSAMRAVRMMRELGVLRRQHDEMQQGFRDLEAFLYRNVSQKRVLDITLSPIAEQHPLILHSGQQIQQRLPGASTGLSDVSIYIDNEAPPSDGVLHVSVSSPDTNQTLAIWEVPAEALVNGWLRFALERALGLDMVSLILTIGYEGNGSVRIASSVQHPEERFWPQMEGGKVSTVLALQIWRWIAGASAPLAARAILPVGGRNRLRRVLGETLTTARNAYNLDQRMQLQSDTSALLIHVEEKRTAAGILFGVALPGARQIYADVRTYHGEAPEVEYQLGIFPSNVRLDQSQPLPDFMPQQLSGWVRLRPLEDGQVHLILPAPLEQSHDIYMMTRLPQGVTSNAFGWSTFANLTLQF